MPQFQTYPEHHIKPNANLLNAKREITQITSVDTLQ